jgi:hypothetical protein
MYDHERRERKNDGEVKHINMPLRLHEPDAQPKVDAYLLNRGLDHKLARANGWYPTEGRGSIRVVIPCVNTAGFNYWQARTIEDHPLRYDSPAIPRKDSIVLLLPRDARGELNYDVHLGKTLVVCEGPCDALAAAEFYPAVALMGGTPNVEVTDHVHKVKTDLGLSRLLIIPDKDNISLIDYFPATSYDVSFLLPTTKDLAGMPRWERTKLLTSI